MTPYEVLAPGADLRTRAGELARQGWTPHDGFVFPAEPWWLGPARIVAYGSVSSSEASQAALDCALRGVGLVVERDDAAPGAVTVPTAQGRAPGAPPDPARAAPAALPLSTEQREVLDLLADGHSIAQAARMRFLSLRTANRRVAEARERLGVATNREAVVAYVKLRGAP